MKNYINLIGQFESKIAKGYWIRALKISDSKKGFLIIYFKLS